MALPFGMAAVGVEAGTVVVVGDTVGDGVGALVLGSDIRTGDQAGRLAGVRGGTVLIGTHPTTMRRIIMRPMVMVRGQRTVTIRGTITVSIGPTIRRPTDWIRPTAITTTRKETI